MPHIKVCIMPQIICPSSQNLSNHILQKHVFEYKTIKPFDTNISIMSILKAKIFIFYLYIGLVTKHIFRLTEFEWKQT
jgi:hypothetical protein